jgi:5-methyltetrahydrofolate--homocysteine methyltransferase
MPYAQIRSRLRSGRPLVVDADIGASLRALGVDLDCPGALGAVLRREPDIVRGHHLTEATRRVDVLSALTADTTPRALAEVGMEHRSAMLTGQAVELALEATELAPKPVAVAGVLGSDLVTAIERSRFEFETREHALRISIAGPELIMVRGMGTAPELRFAVAASCETGLPTWAVVDLEMSSERHIEQLLGALCEEGAEAVLFEVASIEQGLERVQRVVDSGVKVVPGVLLAAGSQALRGFPEPLVAGWVNRSLELTEAGARIVGGGAGTTEAHTHALATALGELHPSLPPSAPGSAGGSANGFGNGSASGSGRAGARA